MREQEVIEYMKIGRKHFLEDLEDYAKEMGWVSIPMNKIEEIYNSGKTAWGK